MKQNLMRVLVRIVTGLMWTSLVLAGLAVVASILVAVAPSILGEARLVVPVQFAADGVNAVIEGSGGSVDVQVSGSTARLSPAGDAPGLMALVAAFLAAGLVVMWMAIRRLRRVLVAAVEGRPFEEGSARDVAGLGWILISSALLRSLYFLAIYLYTQQRLESAQIAPVLRFDSGWLIALGVVVIVLGEVFRKGESLQRDQDLTV